MELDSPQFASPLRPSTGSRFAAGVCCAALLIGYAALAWRAVSTKSPTYDEPLLTLATQIALREHDFRASFMDPPLWGDLVALPGLSLPLTIDPPGSAWSALPGDAMREWPYAMATIYRTPGNDPDALIRRSRAACLALAVLCGGAVAAWAYQLRGPVAAVVSTAFFAFDPNLLAHGALVKNDVVVALLFACGAWAVWRAGRRFGGWHLTGIATVCIGACTCKLSGVILPPLLVALLLVRAMGGAPWMMFGRTFVTRWGRGLAVVGISAVLFAITITGIWAVYGFRFRAIPDGTPLSADRLYRTLASSWHAAGNPGDVFDKPPVRAARFGLEHHLLPEPFVDGALFIYAATLDRPGYLRGEVRRHGWWDYYPLAIAFKFPLATMAAAVLAIAVRCRARRSRPTSLRFGWTTWCVLAPPIVYLLAAMNTATAVGVRHLFPIFPALFVALGCAAAAVWRHRAGKVVVCAIVAWVAVESAAVFPNYLSFFNVAAGGARNGINLLSDSNLDWGQDLPALASWRKQHPGGELYLSYFGTADPAHYGIRYHNLPGGYLLGPPVEWPPGPGYVAVSATNLQGVNSTPANDFGPLLAPLRKIAPVAVLGGSIYVYQVH